MKHKKLIGILATSALLLGSVATFAACGGQEHKIERVDETQATCTEGGHAAYYKCTDEGCDKIFSDIEGKHEIKWDDVEKTDPLGHSMTHMEAKEADCTEDGANEHYHCNRCKNDFADEAGATPMEDTVIPALGHDMEVVEKLIPVTGQPGVKAHYRCERENKEYFDSFGDKKVTDENRHELEYDMLTTAPSGWYDVHHDFSHTNDADPYVTITDKNGLNVATNEYYTDIAYTARVQKANVNRQFIALFFENQAIYSVSVDNGKIKCDSETSLWGYGTEQGYSYLNDDEWKYTLSAGEQDCYEGDGLEVTLARTGKTVKVLVNGQVVHSVTLADEYEATLAKGGMLVWNAVPSVKYYFRAEAQAKAPEAPKVTVAPVDSAQGSVTLNKQTFAYGDELVVTVMPTDDYVFDTLFVNGREITKLTDGTYTTTATNIVNISVVFKAREYGSVNATVTGIKHGVTGNSIAENAAFELVGKNQTYSGSLSNGKLNVNKVLTGEYTLKIANHLSGTINVEKDTAYETAIVLEYDMLAVNNTNGIDANKVDLSHQNDEESYINVTGDDGHLNVTANERYNDVMVTAIFKRENIWNQRMGFLLAFSDKEGVQLGFDTFDDASNVTLHFWYDGEHHSGYASVRDYYNFKQDSFARLNGKFNLNGCAPLKSEWLAKFNGDGLEVSLVRKANLILAMVEGEIVGAVEVDSKYAEDTVQLGFFAEWVNPMRIPFEITTTLPNFETPTFELTQGQNGTVTKTSGDTYSVWEKITLEITPNSNYRLKQLTVNGVVITGNKTEYSFYPVAGANTVVAEFEQIPYGSVNAEITGKKHGVTGNSIADGTKVDLIGADGVEYKNLTVTDGKIAVDEVVAGTYTVKIDGYLDGSITVVEGTAYTTEIALSFNTITVLSGMWYGEDGKVNYAHMNDLTPYFTPSDNGVQIVTGNYYDELLFSVKIKQGEGDKYWTYLLFDDNKYVMTTFDQRNGYSHFELCSWVDAWGFNGSGRENLLNNIWTGYDFNDVEQAQYNGDGISISIYRKGATLYAIVGDKIVFSHTLDGAYATKQVRAGLFIFNSVPNGSYYFEVNDEPTVDLSAAVNVGTVENGSVTASKTTAVYGEEITLTVTPDSGYRVKTVTVNGNVLQASNGVYKFYAATVNEVSAEFEQIVYGSVNAAFTGNKHGVTGNSIADGATVKLVGPKEYTATVTDGKITVSQIEAGTYTVKVEGYLDGTIVIAEGAAYETAIALEYDMFTTYGWFDVHQDFSHQNDANSYVTIKDSNGLNFVTKNEYDQVAVSLTVGKDICDGERTGVMMTFGNKMLWFTVKKTNESITFEWFGDENWGNPMLVPDICGFEGNALTEADMETWNNNTMKIAIVRNGKNFYIFVNGAYRTMLTLNDYETQKVKPGVRAWGAVVGRQYSVSVEEDITEYLNKLPTE